MPQTIPNAFIAIENSAERLPFMAMPDSLTESKRAIYGSMPILGRTEPYRVYLGGTPRCITLPLTFVASVDQRDDGDFEWLNDRTEWCRSLTEPDVDGDDPVNGAIIGPPVVHLVIGQFYVMRGVVTDFTCTYEGPWSIEGSVRESELDGTSNDPPRRDLIDQAFLKAEAAIRKGLGIGKNKANKWGRSPTEGFRKFPALYPLAAKVALTIEEVQIQPLTTRQIRGSLL